MWPLQLPPGLLDSRSRTEELTTGTRAAARVSLEGLMSSQQRSLWDFKQVDQIARPFSHQWHFSLTSAIHNRQRALRTKTLFGVYMAGHRIIAYTNPSQFRTLTSPGVSLAFKKVPLLSSTLGFAKHSPQRAHCLPPLPVPRHTDVLLKPCPTPGLHN